MFGLEKSEWENLALSVNVHRKQRRLSPFGVAALLKRATETADLAAVAEALNSSEPSTLQKILRLTALPEEYASLVEWGSRRGALSMSTAAELLRLENPESVRDAFKLAVEEDLTKDEARQVIQIHKRSGKTVAECVEQALLTRPKVVRHELILGSLVSPNAIETVGKIGVEAAAKKVKFAMAKRYPDVVVQTFRITPPRFSLMFSAADAKTFRTAIAPDTIEQVITRLIQGTEPSERPST